MKCLGLFVEKHNLFFLLKLLYTASYKYGAARKDTKQPQLQPYDKNKSFYICKISSDTLEADERGGDCSSCGVWDVDLTKLPDRYKILSCIFRMFAILSEKAFFLTLIQPSQSILITSHSSSWEGMSLWKWPFYEFTQLTGKMFYFFLKPKKKQINQGLKTRTSEIQKEALQIKCWIPPLRKENQALFSTDFKNKIRKCEHQKSKWKENEL